MKRIILYAAAIEITYLTLSFMLGQVWGQWSYEGEIIRTGLRLIPIVCYGHFYQNFFYSANQSVKTKESLTPQFISALLLLILFAAAYTNAENETILWQIVFVISGFTAGFREELFYRGIIQNSLQKKYNFKIALSCATLIFALSHVQYIYHGQTNGLILITLAGIIFGSIFIYTGSIVFVATIHSLYDAVISINLMPIRLGNEIEIPLLFLITLMFLLIINKELYSPQSTDNADDSNQDNLSLG